MTEYPKLEDMGSDNMSMNSQFGELEESGLSQNNSFSDHNVNGLQHSNTKSDSFVVDMERFSHLIEKDINANSRITLQRNLSRKGSIRGGEKKNNSITTCNERDTLATAPTATLHGASMPEKPMVVAMGATDHSSIPQVHHQITITNGSVSRTATESSKLSGKRFSFRRSSPSTWTLDPRRILFFFATLSCMGTILLIYFTLSMGDNNTESQQ
ncbi:hypothetical protein BUALT_Bualt03G0072300 [Buddleja alternifolia]|uniref:Transmembrane protein n=1 Tax=Buddleja alternifolia TaxID=168488 RepID=A0AAV6XZ59_9LAMI|nr:hypothetical protein BUALT_Bualt03G0072300 [Buddleja alternifolia]